MSAVLIFCEIKSLIWYGRIRLVYRYNYDLQFGRHIRLVWVPLYNCILARRSRVKILTMRLNMAQPNRRDILLKHTRKI